MSELEKDPDAIIVFQDEVHFRAESTIARQWHKKGSKPKVKSHPGEKLLPMAVLLSLKPASFMQQSRIGSTAKPQLTVSANSFPTIKRPVGRRLCIIMDNAPWHKKCRRLIHDGEQHSDIKAAVAIISLPPYSPDLNPIEQAWRIIRREKTHNHFWESVEKLASTLDNWFSGFSRANTRLSALCSFRG